MAAYSLAISISSIYLYLAGKSATGIFLAKLSIPKVESIETINLDFDTISYEEKFILFLKSKSSWPKIL